MQFSFGTIAEAPPPVAVAPLADLAAALAAWKIHGDTASQMIARLAGFLDALDALSDAEAHRWLKGAQTYTMLRYGPLVTPVAPHVWPWAHGVKGWRYQGHHTLIVARGALLALDGPGRLAAHRRWGTLTEGGRKCNGLYRYGRARRARSPGGRGACRPHPARTGGDHEQLRPASRRGSGAENDQEAPLSDNDTAAYLAALDCASCAGCGAAGGPDDTTLARDGGPVGPGRYRLLTFCGPCLAAYLTQLRGVPQYADPARHRARVLAGLIEEEGR